MFDKFNEKTFISNMASDLSMLSKILDKECTTCQSSQQIIGVVAQIKKNNSLNYELKPLEFKFVCRPSHLSHKNIDNLRLYFSINIHGEHKNIPELKDPFSHLEFNIYIVGTNQNNANSNLFYSIHFDRHQEGEKPSKEVHPIYHFQFGGRKIKEKSIDFGQALFMDTPRIMYHPMDIFLGIDFVLSNFFPTVWERLKKDGTYNNLIKKYQSYFVYPYFKTIAQHFEESMGQPWHPKEIYPQLIEAKY